MRTAGIVAIVVILLAVSFIAVQSQTASAETVKVFYEENNEIKVLFPNGMEIEKGGELIIVTSSEVYDMYRSGIMFFECDSEGNKEATTTITPEYKFNKNENEMTHIFSDIQTNVEISFSDLKYPVPGDLYSNNINSNPKEGVTTAVLIASVVIAVIMMIFMITILRDIESHVALGDSY